MDETQICEYGLEDCDPDGRFKRRRVLATLSQRQAPPRLGRIGQGLVWRARSPSRTPLKFRSQRQLSKCESCRRSNFLRENTEVASSTSVAKKSSRSHHQGRFFALAPRVDGRQPFAREVLARSRHTGRPGFRIGPVQKRHPPTPPIQCRWSNHCSFHGPQRRSGQHARHDLRC